ncbi:hypothetical protein HanPSC8_Chr17g0794541 [Helianthus annuus]|nr:hypothetical protein HanPSC8_Chr17g0794541 [Helianthus annuus]
MAREGKGSSLCRRARRNMVCDDPKYANRWQKKHGENKKMHGPMNSENKQRKQSRSTQKAQPEEGQLCCCWYLQTPNSCRFHLGWVVLWSLFQLRC